MKSASGVHSCAIAPNGEIMAIVQIRSVNEEAIQSPLYQQAYEKVRSWILTGFLPPGRVLTLREISEQLGMSIMPVRDAVRRLTAERALRLHDNRRISIPEMTPLGFEQIIFARLALEPELAERAIDHITKAQTEEICRIDDKMDLCISAGDSEGYMRLNYQFHFSIYEQSKCDVLLNLTRGLWLQFGPFMRVAFDHYKASSLVDHHKEATQAIMAHKPQRLRQAISDDIRQGMQFIGEPWRQHASHQRKSQSTSSKQLI